MNTLDTYRLREAWSATKQTLETNGFSLTRGSDFEALESRIGASVKPDLTEHFSSKFNTYVPEEAFWLLVESPDGELVARAAARIDRLSGMTLCEYWRRYWRRCYPGVGEADLEMAQEQPLFSQKIAGDVVYLGDLVVEDAFRRFGVASALVRILQIDALDEWRPTYLYGWMRREHVASRLFPEYGFRQAHPYGIRWANPPATVDGDLTFVGNTRDDLLDLLFQITTQPTA